MSRLSCRGSIGGAAIVVALISSGVADAQVVVVPSPRQPKSYGNPWITGAQYDIVNQAQAERRLQKLQAKFRGDAERGDSAAADRDARRIANVGYRIVVDEWLIRKLSLQDPGCYPFRIDAMSYDAILEAARPAQVINPSLLQATGAMASAPTIGITIVNAAPAGAGVAFAINGVPRQVSGGTRQELIVAPGSILNYDGGGTLGQRQYRLTPGIFEFRSTAEGWALYRLPDMP